jgi:hypothetical protein
MRLGILGYNDLHPAILRPAGAPIGADLEAMLNREVDRQLTTFCASSDLVFSRHNDGLMIAAPAGADFGASAPEYDGAAYIVLPHVDLVMSYAMHETDASDTAVRLYVGRRHSDARLLCKIHRCLERCEEVVARVNLRPAGAAIHPERAPELDQFSVAASVSDGEYALRRGEDGLLHLYGEPGWIGRFMSVESAELVATALRVIARAALRRDA